MGNDNQTMLNIISCAIFHTIIFLHMTDTATGQTTVDPSYIITPHGQTHFGRWGDWNDCPPRMYARAMKMKIQPKQGKGDDNAMTAVRMMCDDGTELIDSREGEIKGDVHKRDHWRKYQTTPNAIYGVSLRSEEFQGKGDDTGANGLRFRDTKLREFAIGDGFWGDWSHFVDCPEGSVITGFATMMMDQNSRKDNSALNQIKFKCSVIPSWTPEPK